MANRLSNSFCRIAIFLLGVFLVVPSVNAGYLDGLNTDGNLAAWYAFDEGTGSSTADSSSNGNTGTLYGVSWLTDSNCVKGACVLSDLNDTIQISPGPTFSNTAANGFASAGWVFWDGNSGGGSTEDFLFEKSFDNIALGVSNWANPYVRCEITSTTYGYQELNTGSTRTLAANTWYHVACVYHKDTNAFRVYVNGVLNRSTTVNFNTFSSGAQTTSSIGNRPLGLTAYGPGLRIDDLRVYNRSLSASEIMMLSGRPSTGSVINPTDSNTIRGTQAIRFSVQDLDATSINDSNLTASVYVSTSAGAYSNLVVRDLNLMNTTVCGDQNFVSTNTCTYDFNSAIYADGTYYIDVNMVDFNAGSLRDTNSFSGNSFVIDNTSPLTIWDNNATAGTNNPVSVTLTCTDARAGCSTTHYRADTDASSTVSYGAWQTYSSALSFSTDGNFALDFNSSDTVGNVESTKTVYVIVSTPESATTEEDNDSPIGSDWMMRSNVKYVPSTIERSGSFVSVGVGDEIKINFNRTTQHGIQSIIFRPLTSRFSGVTFAVNPSSLGDLTARLNGVTIYKELNIDSTIAPKPFAPTSWEAEIHLVVSDDWLNQMNVPPESIRLYHYENDEWVALETTRIGESGGEHYYSARAQSFSPFVIGSPTSTPIPSVMEENTAIPSPQPLTPQKEEKISTPNESPLTSPVSDYSFLVIVGVLMVFGIVGGWFYWKGHKN